MYQAYWGLAESPFRGQHDPRYYHQGAPRKKRSRGSTFSSKSGDRSACCCAPGSGKTFLLELFARRLGTIDRETATVSLVGCGLREFLWSVAEQLGVVLPTDATTFTLTRALADHVVANRFQRVATILLLDDADEARPEVLDEILRLAQLDSSRDSRMSIVIAAQNHRVARLGQRLLDLTELRIDLDGWEVEDTVSFVKSALASAGRTMPIFSDSGLSRLHELAGGAPRRVKQLADLALLAGAGQNLSQIDADTVESACYELGIVAPATSSPSFARR